MVRKPRFLRNIAVATGLIFFLGGVKIGEIGTIEPAIAQFISPQEVAPFVYEQLTEFPLENQYISLETGEIAANHTLIRRLLSYHLYIKNRLPDSRLDWKLTIADYLGVHDKIDESRYPGHNSLSINPFAQDLAIIDNLDRQQREQLISALIATFTPKQETETPTPTSQPTPTSTPSQNPSLPQRGNADLLK
ncbi:MAG: hypothetical protein WA865_15890 [Spirulinaceae cyanobacterium]